MISSDLVAALPREQQLALVYAPAPARAATLALFALDTRLASLVRGLREPMLGQLRLAWWREQLTRSPGQRATGEPVLAALAAWSDCSALVALVDGWEVLTDPAALDASRVAEFAEGRARAWAGLAQVLGLDVQQAGTAHRAACGWALADLGARLSDEGGRAAASRQAAVHDWTPAALPRSLRPLAVLHGLSARSRGVRPLLDGVPDLIAAMRLGLLGR